MQVPRHHAVAMDMRSHTHVAVMSEWIWERGYCFPRATCTPAITEGDHSELLKRAKPASAATTRGRSRIERPRTRADKRSDLSLQRLILQHSFGTARMLALGLPRGKYGKNGGTK
jgi:hypothetical protein